MSQWCWVFLALLLPTSALGQYGRLIGAIYDEEGEPIASAKVTAILQSSRASPHETLTAEDGSFVLENLLVGNYELAATKEGKEPLRQENIRISKGADTELYLWMEPAFIYHDALSLEFLEEVTYCSEIEPIIPPSLIESTRPGLTTQGFVVPVSNRGIPYESSAPSAARKGPPPKTVDEIFAVELTQKTKTRYSKKLKELQIETFPGPEAFQLMRHELALRGERLRAIAFFPLGIHPYLAMTFIESGDEIYWIGTAVSWSHVYRKFVGRMTKAEFEDLITQSTTILDCSVTCGEPRGQLLYFNSAGIPTQCEGDWWGASSEKLALLFEEVTRKARTSYRDLDLNLWWRLTRLMKRVTQ